MRENLISGFPLNLTIFDFYLDIIAIWLLLNYWNICFGNITGADDAMDPCVTDGYLSLNQAARLPGYDPPTVMTLLLVAPRDVLTWDKSLARSANAWSALR